MKKFFYFATIFAFALFLLPACEKEVISSDDADDDKEEQVDSDSRCYFASIFYSSYYEGSYEEDVIYISTWGPRQRVENAIELYVDYIIRINSEDPYVENFTATYNIEEDSECATNKSDCQDGDYYWPLEQIIEASRQ